MRNIGNSKFQQVLQFLFLLLIVIIMIVSGEMNVEASFGRRPARYSDLTEGHRMFLAEVAHQKGYVAYSDVKTLSQELLTAFNAMKSAASQFRIKLSIVSGYRSYDTQVSTFFGNGNIYKPITRFYSDRLTETEIQEVRRQYLARSESSAIPGFSEHSTGLAIDINTTGSNFANTAAYRWLQQHASEFGFTLSYPKNSTRGANFEPWHWRFDGNDRYRNSTPISSLAEQLSEDQRRSHPPLNPITPIYPRLDF